MCGKRQHTLLPKGRDQVAEPLRLVVCTPSEILLDVDPVEWVHVELAEGEALTIWPGHLPVLGETAPAALRYADRDGTHTVECPPGILHLGGRTVTLFVAAAVGEQTWEEQEQVRRYTRLSETLIASLSCADDA
jgi:F0F1-type ATP synthase epsilon subunit